MKDLLGKLRVLLALMFVTKNGIQWQQMYYIFLCKYFYLEKCLPVTMGHVNIS